MAIKANPSRKGCYTVKSYDNYLYTWCPEEPSYDKKAQSKGGRKYFCDAVPGSQGEDWTTTYCYNTVIDSTGMLKRLAYVACDYVE